MARPVETGAGGTYRLRVICALAALSLLGLGIWRGADVFSQSAETPGQLSVQQQSLLHVIEPLAGPGNARITVHRSGANARDFLVLINSDRRDNRSIAEDVEAILVSAAGFNTEAGDTLTVREFPFADGAAARPDVSEMIELGAIGALVFLLSWGAFAPQKPEPEAISRARTKRTVDERPTRTRPVAVDMPAHSSNKMSSAARTASEDPSGTAKIIRAWMRAPESTS